jgi:hypothetical protein
MKFLIDEKAAPFFLMKNTQRSLKNEEQKCFAVIHVKLHKK